MNDGRPEKQDIRIRKTRKLLLHGLTQLMEKKSIKHITVRELTDLCDLNRATFYLHYRDIYDMVEKIENEMLENFNTAVNKHSTEELKENPSLIFIEIFEFIYENSDMCRVLLGENGDYAFVEKLKNIIKTKAFSEWLNFYSDDNTGVDEELYYSFVVSGCIGAIRYWTDEDFRTSADEMAIKVADMVLNGVKFLKK